MEWNPAARRVWMTKGRRRARWRSWVWVDILSFEFAFACRVFWWVLSWYHYGGGTANYVMPRVSRYTVVVVNSKKSFSEVLKSRLTCKTSIVTCTFPASGLNLWVFLAGYRSGSVWQDGLFVVSPTSLLSLGVSYQIIEAILQAYWFRHHISTSW